jgi:arginine repressor
LVFEGVALLSKLLAYALRRIGCFEKYIFHIEKSIRFERVFHQYFERMFKDVEENQIQIKIKSSIGNTGQKISTLDNLAIKKSSLDR